MKYFVPRISTQLNCQISIVQNKDIFRHVNTLKYFTIHIPDMEKLFEEVFQRKEKEMIRIKLNKIKSLRGKNKQWHMHIAEGIKQKILKAPYLDTWESSM